MAYRMTMDHDEYTRTVLERFRNDDLDVKEDTIEGISVTVAAVRAAGKTTIVSAPIPIPSTLHFYTYCCGVMGFFDHVSKSTVERFSASSHEYVKKASKGTQKKGVASIPILMSSHVDGEARDWVQRKVKPHYQAIEVPVIIDLENNRLHYCQKAPFRMRIFYFPARDFVEKYLRTSKL